MLLVTYPESWNRFAFFSFFPFTPKMFRVLHESLYGYQNSIASEAGQPQPNSIFGLSDLDDDLALALRISEQEQQQRQDELRREQEMIEEALRLSLEEITNRLETEVDWGFVEIEKYYIIVRVQNRF